MSDVNHVNDSVLTSSSRYIDRGEEKGSAHARVDSIGTIVHPSQASHGSPTPQEPIFFGLNMTRVQHHLLVTITREIVAALDARKTSTTATVDFKLPLADEMRVRSLLRALTGVRS